MNARCLTVGLLLALAAGCATVRSARRAQDPAKAPPGERTVSAAEAGLCADTVLTESDAERMALAFSPSVTRARLAASNALEQTRQAVAAYWPSLRASAGGRRATSNSEAQRNANRWDTSYSAGLSAEMTLFDFGRTPAQVRQAAAGLRAAEQAVRGAEHDALFAVRVAFYELGKAGELLRVAEDTVRQFEVRRDQVRGLVEVGRRIRYDLTKAEVDLGNAMLARIDASNGVVTARATLNRALGLAEDPGYRIAPVEMRRMCPSLPHLVALARERQPELAGLRAEEAAASAAVDAAVADLYPSLGLSGSYGGGGDDLPLVWNWAMGVSGAATLFDGGARLSRIETAALRLRSARAAVAAREQQLCLDLSRAVSALESNGQRMDLSALIVRQSQENMELIRERYRLGRATAVELTDAQAALAQAQADEVKARYDYLAAIAQIARTTGEP
jgi:outer membrane protein TolC